MSSIAKRVETRGESKAANGITGIITTWLGEGLRWAVLFPALRLFVCAKVYGSENLQGEGPYILAANHASHLDAPLLLASLPLRLRLRVRVVAAADYFFSQRWKGALVRVVFNAFCFERKGAGSMSSLTQAQRLLCAGHSLLLFPEGTRSQDGQLQPFKWGVGKLALDGSVSVIPTWIDGTYAALPKGARWPHPQKIAIWFGAPMQFAPTSSPLSITAEIERQVRALASADQARRNERTKGMTTKNYRGIYGIKPWWQQRLAGLENRLVKWRIHPDLVTLAGVGCAGLMGLALAASARWPLLVLAVVPLAIGRLAANALDGLVARRTGLARPWGEVYNECCDRISDTLIFIGLAFNSQVIAPLAWGVLVLILLNSYLGVAAKAAGGKRQFGGLLAKADRMIYMAVFSLLTLFLGPSAWNWLLLVFAPATVLTIVQRIQWSYSDLKQVEARRRHDGNLLAN